MGDMGVRGAARSSLDLADRMMADATRADVEAKAHMEAERKKESSLAHDLFALAVKAADAGPMATSALTFGAKFADEIAKGTPYPEAVFKATKHTAIETGVDFGLHVFGKISQATPLIVAIKLAIATYEVIDKATGNVPLGEAAKAAVVNIPKSVPTADMAKTLNPAGSTSMSKALPAMKERAEAESSKGPAICLPPKTKPEPISSMATPKPAPMMSVATAK